MQHHALTGSDRLVTPRFGGGLGRVHGCGPFLRCGLRNRRDQFVRRKVVHLKPGCGARLSRLPVQKVGTVTTLRRPAGLKTGGPHSTPNQPAL